MPIIFQEMGLDFRIEPENREPPYVLAKTSEGSILVRLGVPGKTPPQVETSDRVSPQEISSAEKVCIEHQADFLESWRKIQRPRGLLDLQRMLLGSGELDRKLKIVTDTIVDLFAADFARIWVVGPGDLCKQGCMHSIPTEGPHVCWNRERCLHLIASSGRYTHTDGVGHRRVPLGAYKIGLVAAGVDHKFLTNDVTHDPRVHNHAWAAELDLVAFAGYQLRPPGGEPLGVLALFSKSEISREEDEQLDSLSFSTAQTIDVAKKESSLWLSEARLHAFLDNSPDAVWICTPDLKFSYMNRTGSLWLGKRAENIVGKAHSEIFSPEIAVRQEEILRGIFTTGKVFEGDFFHEVGSQKRWQNVRVFPLTDAAGNLFACLGMVRDITDQKRFEETLGFHSLLLNHMSEGILLVKVDDLTIVYANPACERIFGYEAGTLLGKGVNVLGSPEDPVRLESLRQMEASLKSSGFWKGKIRNSKKDGTRFWSLVTMTGFKHPFFGDVSLGVHEDVTERVLMEDEHERLSSAISQSGEIVIVTDSQGTIQYVNPVFELVTGYSKEEVLGKNPRILKGGTHSTKFYEELWETIRSGKTWRGRLVNRKKSGITYHEDATISPVRDDSGAIMNFVAVKRDVSDLLKLQEEQEKLRSQLLQSQKMEAVGRLAGGVAHDFNNMLGVILGYSELLLDLPEISPAIRSDVQEILNAAERSRNLTRQLLGFARKQLVDPKVLDLNETIEGMGRMLHRLIGENIELIVKPCRDPWLVKLDPSQVDQILVNLSVNSRDAIEGVGAIIIETDNVILDREFCEHDSEPLSGEFVLLAVSDTGKGMAKDVLKHLFEPFFTTKAVGKGSGLGLAMVYGIVRQNYGFIKVYSEIAKGTTIKMYFPRFKDIVAAEVEKAPKSTESRGETILVVEDEESLLHLTCRLLKGSGYTVLSAETPTKAIRLAKNHSGKIHLLLTDVIMPEMTGRDLANCLTSVIPNLKFLFMSGYTANVIAHQNVLEEGTNFIQKPFSNTDLSTKIRKVLE
jgi:PAS domain S-box-containing protein